MTKQALNAIDLFSGCGGLSAGMVQAGFNSKVSIEIDKYAVLAYRMNHPETIVIENDIRKVSSDDIIAALNGEPLHLLAGCPPCQGFSSVRRLNRKQNVRDDRNALILEYLRFVKELKPLTIMMENVPGLINYYLFKYVVKELDELGYSPKVMERIRLTPKDGGSWKDLPEKYILECHKKEKVGFQDIYGRLSWNDISSTITGGCLNPSKGRFLHPEEDRVITAREASLLQSFPIYYKFPVNIPKSSLALLIGNALPPKFSYIQSMNIKKHLDKHLG